LCDIELDRVDHSSGVVFQLLGVVAAMVGVVGVVVNWVKVKLTLKPKARQLPVSSIR